MQSGNLYQTRMRLRNEKLWGFLLVAPTIIGLLILNIIPIFRTLVLSFYKSGDFGKKSVYVGLENYRVLIHDSQVLSAIINTLSYTAIVVPVSIIIGLFLAVVLNRDLRGKNIYRIIYFIPMVATPAAITMVWKWLFNKEFGLINHLLKSLGAYPVDWINGPGVAIFSICIIGIWCTIGYNMILFLAGLQEIPHDYYEAMEIDGAGEWKKFYYITLPLVSPTMFFVAVTSIIQSLQVFDVIFMMVGVTSPAYEKSVSLVYLFYNNSFRYSNKGYGSAIVMVLLGLIFLITLVQLKLQKKWVKY